MLASGAGAGKPPRRKKKNEVSDLCAECGSDVFVDDAASGDLICTECGLVKEGCRVDERAEWRSFEDDKGSKERAGPALNPLLDDGGLGSSVSVQLQPGLLHLARVQASLKDPNKRLKQGFQVVGEMCDLLRLGGMVKDRACEIFKDAEKHLKERKIHEACAACIYVACRIEKCPRTFKEITAVSKNTHMVIIMRCFKVIVNKLGIRHHTMETVKPSDYLDRFCKNLEFSQVGTRLAKHMGAIASDKDHQKQWDGKSPVSIAGGILMYVSQISQEDRHINVNTISSHTGASISAIRSALATIQKESDSLIPAWWIEVKQEAAPKP
ncbi:transcription factor TFIIB [Chloropicon roscoffensis]|uniref:General transcription factor TFIIB n=2 Tax=Chloropicon roscoffensis TaxID=1461544 RepID=A0AAX4PEG8_9CHLO